jgi:hypothetical protein
MFNQSLIDHFQSVGINPENVEKNVLDAYIDAVKSDSDAYYLPDPSISSLDRAVEILNRMAAENPDLSVAITPFRQPDKTYTTVSTVWGFCRIDMLFPFTPSIDETVWVTARSAANTIGSFYWGESAHKNVEMTMAKKPEWAEHGFLLLIGVPPLGISVSDLSNGTEVEFHEETIEDGALQKAASLLYDHHILNETSLTDDERKALFGVVGVTFENSVVGISTLVTIGELNVFASRENILLRETAVGTVAIGECVTISPKFSISPQK